MREVLGTWVGLNAKGVIVAAHSVMDPAEEEDAREFVTAGTRTVLRVGPEVRVRMGDPLPAAEPSRG